MHKLLIVVALLFAQQQPLFASKETDELKAKLAQTEADLAAANLRNAAAAKIAAEALAAATRNTTALGNLKQGQDANRSAAAHQADISTATAINTNIAAATNQAQLDVARKAAEEATKAAEIAKSQATAANAGSRQLFIIQVFTFLTVLAGFLYKAWERKSDLKETLRKEQKADDDRREAAEALKLQGAQITQIHSLVNSGLTEEKQAVLDSRIDSLILMEAAVASVKASGHEPSEVALDRISESKKKIEELKQIIAERIKQADEAAAQFKADMGKPLPTSAPSTR